MHPPLGKMLVGLAGALSGFNGSYDFPSGQVYPDHVPFRAMRVMLAMPGVAMVPLAWGTSLELGFSNYAKHIVTLMTLCGESLCANASFDDARLSDGIVVPQTWLGSSFLALSCSIPCFSSSPLQPSISLLASTINSGSECSLYLKASTA